MGDIVHSPIKISVQSQNSLPFNVQLDAKTGSLAAYFRYCALGINAYPTASASFVPAQTEILMLDTLGNPISDFPSVSGSASEISSDGTCFTAHAAITNVTGTFLVFGVEIIIRPSSALPGSSCSGSLASCYARKTYFPVSPQQNGLVLSTLLPRALGSNEAVDALVTLKDTQRPVWTGCPDDIRVVADAGSATVEVSWVVPFVTDNVAIASVDAEVTNFAGSPVVHRMDVRSAVHTYTYTATDTSGLSSVCT